MAELTLVDRCGPETRALLERVQWGTDGLLYRSHDIGEALALVPELRTAELRVGGELVGCYAFAFKDLDVDGFALQAIHRMFLAVDPAHGGRGYGQQLVEGARDLVLAETAGPTLLYGYVEADNTRSLKVTGRGGYATIGRFRGSVLSRLRPADDPAVGTVAANGAEIAERLAEAYAGHALVDLDDSLCLERYQVLRHRGRIVAGAQVLPRKWTVEALPGPLGGTALWLLPRLPVVGRMLPGRSFDHLCLGNLLIEDGPAFFRLVEALLARHGKHAALWFADPQCPVAARLEGAGRLGALGGLAGDGLAEVRAGAREVPDAVMNALRAKPVYVSPLDPT